MIARVTTILPGSAERLWGLIVQPRSLRYVASPLLYFVPVDGGALPEAWDEGVDYTFRLYFLGFLPMGRHTIRLVRIDREGNALSSREGGPLVPVWNHEIRFRELGPGRLWYSDEIEIRAGWLTPAIWLFAQVFYRHRQRRWRKLLRLE